MPCLRDRKRNDEHGYHCDRHGDPDNAHVGPGLLPEPGEGAPGPPQQGQDEEALDQTHGVMLVHHEGRHLRHREDEYQVEEQLERGHAMGVIDGAHSAEHLCDLGHGQEDIDLSHPLGDREPEPGPHPLTGDDLRQALADPASWLLSLDGHHRVLELLTTDRWDQDLKSRNSYRYHQGKIVPSRSRYGSTE